jgi:phospholipid/cholesterol/gamma-HCH transport system ATP-binding protein
MKTDSETVIRVENLTAGYGDVAIIKDINFEVKAGEVFIILGGSGCGKSTLLKHMIGLLPPVTGKVLIEGKDIVSAHGRERIDILRRIGVMSRMVPFSALWI